MTRRATYALAMLTGMFALLAGAAAPTFADSQAVRSTCNGSIQITATDPNGNPTSAAYGGPCAATIGVKNMHGVITVTGPASSSVCGAAGGFAAEHSDILTTADGSQLRLRVVENACQEAPGSYHCIGTYTVIGGTGRFAGDRGAGDFDGHVSFNPDGSGTFQASYSGSVSTS
jgi:hypothetical protein